MGLDQNSNPQLEDHENELVAGGEVVDQVKNWAFVQKRTSTLAYLLLESGAILIASDVRQNLDICLDGSVVEDQQQVVRQKAKHDQRTQDANFGPDGLAEEEEEEGIEQC